MRPLLLVACLGLTAVGHAAGRIDFSVGDVSVRDATGTALPAAKREQLGDGVTVSTSANGRVHVRLADDTYVSLQPNSELRLDSERRGVEVTVSRGTVRVITRASEHRLRTPHGSIATSAAEYLLSVRDVIEISVSAGALEWCNTSRCTALREGDAARLASAGRPEFLERAPFVSAPLPSLATPVLRRADEALPTQLPAAAMTLPSGSGYTVAMAGIFETEVPTGGIPPFPPFEVLRISTTRLHASGDATFIGNDLVVYTSPQVGGTGVDGYEPALQVSSSDGVIGWGRWTTGIWRRFTPGCPSCGEAPHRTFWNVHFVVGPPTPAADMQSLASGAFVGTYSLIGFTQPTAGTDQSIVGTQPVTGSMTAFFGSGRVEYGLGVPIGGAHYALTGNVPIDGATFAGPATVNSVVGCGGTVQCTEGRVVGTFVGPSAARAGLTYRFSQTGLNPIGEVGGAVTFRQTGLGR